MEDGVDKAAALLDTATTLLSTFISELDIYGSAARDFPRVYLTRQVEQIETNVRVALNTLREIQRSRT